MITQSRPECRNAGPRKRYKGKMFLIDLNGSVSDVENRISPMEESGEEQ